MSSKLKLTVLSFLFLIAGAASAERCDLPNTHSYDPQTCERWDRLNMGATRSYQERGYRDRYAPQCRMVRQIYIDRYGNRRERLVQICQRPPQRHYYRY